MNIPVFVSEEYFLVHPDDEEGARNNPDPGVCPPGAQCRGK